VYLLGNVFGAVTFAYLSQRYGRRRLFMVSLVIYIVSMLFSLITSYPLFTLSRFFTGIAIGGEYTAIFA
jgi:MFS family permease